MSLWNSKKITKLDVSVDGRLTELLNLTHTSALAEGAKQEQDRTKEP